MSDDRSYRLFLIIMGVDAAPFGCGEIERAFTGLTERREVAVVITKKQSGSVKRLKTITLDRIFAHRDHP